MEEKVFKMEYIIDGEKYLITVTKVASETKEETKEVSNLKKPIEFKKEFTNLPEEVVGSNEDATFVSVADIPDCVDLATWMSIVENYGIVLMK